MASHFKDLIKKFFTAVASKYYEKVNGSKDEPTYLHTTMLVEEYSVDMTYASINGEYTRVTADIVSFDSPLPIKKRGAIKKATGTIPKMGLKFTLNEKQMNTLRILKSMKGRASELARKVFQDVEGVIFGIKELIEYAHLTGLSSGTMLIADATNSGHGVRITYGIPQSNFNGAVKKWSDPAAKPLDDIKRVMKAAKAKGYKHDNIWMDDATATRLLSNAQVKQSYAFTVNFVGDTLPDLDDEQLVKMFKNKMKLTLNVIDRSFTFEKNGTRTVKQGWTENMVVLTIGTTVGSLVYSTLAEEEFPVDGVDYAKPNAYILVSKSGDTDPVSEKTAGQALAIPVLQDVESLFYIDSEEAVDDAQTEGDANFDYDGTSYTRASVITAINTANENANADASMTDAALLDIINALNNEEIAIFEPLLVAA